MSGERIMMAQFGRVLPVAHQDRVLTLFDRIERRRGWLNDHDRWARETLLRVRALREAAAQPEQRQWQAIRRMTSAEVAAEINALDARSRRERLSIEESGRLAALITREARLEQLLAAKVERARVRLAQLEGMADG